MRRLSQTGTVVGYSEDLAIEKRPKMGCNWASKSPSSELLISEFSFFKFCVVFPDTTYAYSVFADFGQRVQLGK
jgi:hypothetical protein